jgi:hypothetical protein
MDAASVLQKAVVAGSMVCSTGQLLPVACCNECATCCARLCLVVGKCESMNHATTLPQHHNGLANIVVNLVP